jgi:hypothetical protein
LRVLTAALIALIVVYALRLWAIGSGLGLVSSGDIWVLRLVTFWDIWALAYLGLTWLLIMRSSAQQTRQWALDQRIPPHPDLSILRSVTPSANQLWHGRPASQASPLDPAELAQQVS